MSALGYESKVPTSVLTRVDRATPVAPKTLIVPASSC